MTTPSAALPLEPPHAPHDPSLDPTTPLLLLGGGANGVAVARNLTPKGVRVSVAGGPGAWARRSRHVDRVWSWPATDLAGRWRALLLGSDRALDGHMVWPLCDDSIAFVAQHRDALAERYLLEGFRPDLRLAMLDKRDTLARARAAGVDTPKFWTIRTAADLQRYAAELAFPMVVKPVHSHLFIPVFGRKLFIVEDMADLRDKIAQTAEHGIEVVAQELIPGPDSLLSSFYTYIDERGARLFDYTKRVIRRYPVMRGGGCFHQSVWLPETAAAGRRFFEGIGWQGMGNVEFKRDPRDGRLKLIECNPRFTAAHALVTASGVPIDEMIYRHLTGQPVEAASQTAEDLRLWTPTRDLMAFLSLRARGELTLTEWIGSLREGRHVRSTFSLSDPSPALLSLSQEIKRTLGRAKGAARVRPSSAKPEAPTTSFSGPEVPVAESR